MSICEEGKASKFVDPLSPDEDDKYWLGKVQLAYERGEILCSWHVLTNSEATNPRIFFTKFFLVFKQGRILLLRSKKVSITKSQLIL